MTIANMTIDRVPRSRMTVTPLEEFLKKPPVGFSVELFGSGYRVHSDAEKSLVLIDDLDSCKGKIVFQNSLGRKVKMQNLWEYTSMRNSLLSKRIYLLVSACEDICSASNKKAASEVRVLQQYVVSIDGNDPFIRWQMVKGLDWTISSVAGESYRVDVDLTEPLESWAEKNMHVISDKPIKPVWTDASFTLKYYSDALFDFPHWFGFSKRKFKEISWAADGRLYYTLTGGGPADLLGRLEPPNNDYLGAGASVQLVEITDEDQQGI